MVPEGLLPTLTLALVLANQRMAKRNVLIRYLPSVETLGSTTVICTDKTGTLTQGQMMVRQLYLGETFDLSAGVRQETGPCRSLSAFLPDSPDVPRSKGNRASRKSRPFWAIRWKSRWWKWRWPFISATPVYPRVDEIPFDADRMRLSTCTKRLKVLLFTARVHPSQCFLFANTFSLTARFSPLALRQS